MPGAKRKQYDKSVLQAAVRQVQKGQSVSKVSKLFGIPRITLYDHSRGTLQGNFRNPGIDFSLTSTEEEALIHYIKYMADRGQPLTTSVFQRFVTAIIKRGGRRTRINLTKGPSKKWCRKFFKRHPQLKFRKPDKADDGRLNVTLCQVQEYFQLLSQTISRLDLHNHPECIYNCDETGFNGHELMREKVVTVGKQHPYQKHMITNVGHLTLQLAISGDGKIVPPMLIFSKSLPRAIEGLPDSWQCVASPKGYMDAELFCSWLEKTFVPHCGRRRPVLLVMDNLGAHLTPRAIDIARANDIELLCLPAHSTHLLQPLDVHIFHLLKCYLAKAASRLGYQLNHISRAQMPLLIKYSLNMLSACDIIESFRLTGIIPCNPNVIATLKQTLKDDSDHSTNENTLSENPLVDMGIIPASLKDILLPPPTKQMKRKPLGARLLTAPPEEPQAGPSRDTESVATEHQDDISDDSVIIQYPNDGICVVCMTNMRMEWVGCDMCPNWFHYQCLNAENRALVDLSIITKDPWSCGFCDEE